MNYIDNLVNRITMYRLLLYGLLLFVPIAVLFAYLGILQMSPLGLLASAGILLVTSYVVNKLLAHLYGAYSNSESALITALILFCIFSPPTSYLQGYQLAVMAVIAMASKYVLAFRRRHVFNPAAVGAVVASLLGLTYASWWIATPSMLPFAAILGLVLVRKIHRWPMFLAYAATAYLVSAYSGLSMHAGPLATAQSLLLSAPIVFLGTIMLTEPETTPPHAWQQVINGVLVGYLSNSGLHLGKALFMSPEMALVIGNVFSYGTILRRRIDLVLANVRLLGNGIYQLSFDRDRGFAFMAGQYLELTILIKDSDWRGNRRTFTIASSPTEGRIEFGVKAGYPRSAFKTALLSMSPGDHVYSTHLAGDFILPRNKRRKLLFIAGGIGITPFRSMLKYLVDTGQQRDIVLVYAVSHVNQFVYLDVIQQAMAHGLRVVWIINGPAEAFPEGWQGERGRLSTEMLLRNVPDVRERLCYTSGPNAMVVANRHLLKGLGVARRHIKSDYFSGF